MRKPNPAQRQAIESLKRDALYHEQGREGANVLFWRRRRGAVTTDLFRIHPDGRTVQV